MIRILQIIFIAITFYTTTYAQHIDSLRNLSLQYSHADTVRVNLLISFSKELYRSGLFAESIVVADSARILSQKLHFNKGIGEAWLASGYAYYKQSEYKTALLHYNEAHKIFEKEKRSSELAKAYLYTGQVYDFLGEYKKAARNYTNSLNLLKGTSDTKSIASIYNSIGNNYFNQGSYELAIDYYYKSLTISESLKEKRLIASTCNNLGAAYEKLTQYNDALTHYNRALPLVKELNSKNSIALAYANIGGILVALKRYDEAEPTLIKGLKLQEEINDRRGMIYSYSNLASLHFGKKDFEISENYYKQALNIANEIGDPETSLSPAMQLASLYIELGRNGEASAYLINTRAIASAIKTPYWLEQNYLLSSKLDSATKNYKRAYYWHKQYVLMKDSLFNAAKSEQVAQMKELYNSEKKDSEIERLKEAKRVEELKRAFSEKIFIILLSAASLIVGGLVYGLRHKTKTAKLLKDQKEAIGKSNEELRTLLDTIQKQSIALTTQNEKLEELHREKDAFVGIIAHDLRSPLNKAAGLASIVPLCGGINEEQRDILARIHSVCKDGNKLINDLLVINQVESESKEKEINFTTIKLPDFIKDILSHFEAQANQKNITLLLNCSLPGSCEVVTDAYYLSRIVDNLLSNALKFSPAGRSIGILLTVDDKNISIAVKDEGQGIRQEEMPYLFKKFKKLSARPTAGETSTGLGLSIVKLLTEKLKGSVAVESTWGKGTTFTINLPVAFYES